jgi:hypothetical protein
MQAIYAAIVMIGLVGAAQAQTRAQTGSVSCTVQS